MTEDSVRRPAYGARRPTSRDVAELAGVSQSAVSRTFTEGSSVSEETRARVTAAAAALYYTPNYAARSLVTNRSSIIGVAMSHLDNHYYPEVLERLSEALAQVGYRVLLFITHAADDQDPVLQELLRYRVDALVMASRSLSGSLALEFQRRGLPVVMFNNLTPEADLAGVAGNNVIGGATVAAYLLETGHRKLAFITGVEDSLTSRERENSFAVYIQRQGLDAPLRIPGQYDFTAAAAATRTLLTNPAPPDAIFCANDHMAFAAIQVARLEFGLEPGRDISVVGRTKLVFINKMWTKTGMTRLSGRAPKGPHLVAPVPHGHRKTRTFVDTLRTSRLTAPGGNRTRDGWRYAAAADAFRFPATMTGMEERRRARGKPEYVCFAKY